jgi:carbon storage regulator
MLVLGRRIGETICIGNNISITVLETKGSHVRIGINAPTDIPILRDELCTPLNRMPNKFGPQARRKAVLALH